MRIGLAGVYDTGGGIPGYKCPICKKWLNVGDKKVYETLCEHVEDPNKEIEPRWTLVCINPNCQLFKKGFFSWEEGAWYGKLDETKSLEPLLEKLGVQYMPPAIGSIDYKIERSKRIGKELRLFKKTVILTFDIHDWLFEICTGMMSMSISLFFFFRININYPWYEFDAKTGKFVNTRTKKVI